MMTKHDDIKEQKKKDEEEVEKKEEKHDEVGKLAQKLDELENNYRRALADYQNLQKRVTQERQDWIKISNRELLLRLLPVLDTLMLASKHVDDKGLKVSVDMFLDTLKAEGITRIKTAGEDFNPETMECIQIEEGEDGKVLEEVRVGYMIHDKLLRPAQVKVGQKKKD